LSIFAPLAPQTAVGDERIVATEDDRRLACWCCVGIKGAMFCAFLLFSRKGSCEAPKQGRQDKAGKTKRSRPGSKRSGPTNEAEAEVQETTEKPKKEYGIDGTRYG
jgi:hypothetical protein